MNQHLSDSRGEPVIIFLHFPLSPCAPNLAGHLSTLATQYGVVLSHQQKNRCQTRVFVHFPLPSLCLCSALKTQAIESRIIGHTVSNLTATH